MLNPRELKNELIASLPIIKRINSKILLLAATLTLWAHTKTSDCVISTYLLTSVFWNLRAILVFSMGFWVDLSMLFFFIGLLLLSFIACLVTLMILGAFRLRDIFTKLYNTFL
jgi:hypothetical protein